MINLVNLINLNGLSINQKFVIIDLILIDEEGNYLVDEKGNYIDIT